MKKLFFRFMALFTAITILVGCEKNNFTPEKEGQLQTLTVAALSSNADTKVNFTSNEGDALGFKVEWAVGDRLIASSADGETYIATFEIKAADDIAADGSAKFTALEGTTTFLDPGTSYKFHQGYTTYSYNEATDISPYDNYYDEAFDKNSLMHSILHTASATTISNTITLSHLLSYVELTVDVADKSNTIVRFKYTDKATSKEFIHKYELYNWDGTVDGTNYTFNFPIYPATLDAATPITVEISNDYGSNYTNYLSIAKDGAFESGKHYRIKKAAAIGFPGDAVAVVKATIGMITKTSEFTPDGKIINEDNKDYLSDMLFFIGYNKKIINKNLVYATFKDVTWSSSEEVYPFNTDPYTSLTRNDDGSVKLTLLKDLPSSKETITITATAPNGDEKSFKIILQGNIALVK